MARLYPQCPHCHRAMTHPDHVEGSYHCNRCGKPVHLTATMEWASPEDEPAPREDSSADRGITAIVAGVLLLGICLAIAVGVYFIAHSFGTDPPPVFLSLDPRGCTTTGQWTVARFNVLSATPGLDPTSLAWGDAATGKSTHDAIAPLALSTPNPTLIAGDRVHIYTQAGHASDIRCDTANQLQVTQPSANRIITTPKYSLARPVYALAVSLDDCVTTSSETSATLVVTRAPPGWAKNNVRIDDAATAASTEAGGNQKLQLSGMSNPFVLANDALDLSTKHNRPEQMSCTDTLHVIDKTDGTTLRDVTLTT